MSFSISYLSNWIKSSQNLVKSNLTLIPLIIGFKGNNSISILLSNISCAFRTLIFFSSALWQSSLQVNINIFFSYFFKLRNTWEHSWSSLSMGILGVEVDLGIIYSYNLFKSIEYSFNCLIHVTSIRSNCW